MKRPRNYPVPIDGDSDDSSLPAEVNGRYPLAQTGRSVLDSLSVTESMVASGSRLGSWSYQGRLKRLKKNISAAGEAQLELIQAETRLVEAGTELVRATNEYLRETGQPDRLPYKKRLEYELEVRQIETQLLEEIDIQEEVKDQIARRRQGQRRGRRR